MTEREIHLPPNRSQILHVSFGKHLNCRRVLILMCFAILAIIAFRFYHMSVTGYMLPDEGYYYERLVLDHNQYPHREVFSRIYVMFFEGAKDISSLALRGAIFTSIWGLGSAFLSYKIVRRLGMTDEQTSLLLVSLLFFPVYLIMLPMMVTENMAFFFGLAGIFFALRFHQRGGWNDALFSSLAFVAACNVREPYLLFGLANFVGILVSTKRSVRSVLAYLIPLALVIPIPVNVWPLQFAQPVYALLLNPLVSPVSSVSLSPQVTMPPPDLPSFLHAFAIGIFVGYNPVFAVIAFVSILLTIRTAWRKRTALAGFPPWNALAGLSAYAAALFFLIYPAGGLIPVWTSTAMRASHASLPVAFTFSHSYRKIGARNVVVMLLVLLAVGSTQLYVIAQAVQSNLTPTGAPVDRLSLDYRAPYYRLYELAKDSGRTLVLAPNPRGARTYLSMLPNAQVMPIPGDQSQFNTVLAEGWDMIYLYDYYYTGGPTLADPRYPQYYREILISSSYPGYVIERLWSDAESYAFMMTPVAST